MIKQHAQKTQVLIPQRKRGPEEERPVITDPQKALEILLPQTAEGLRHPFPRTIRSPFGPISTSTLVLSENMRSAVSRWKSCQAPLRRNRSNNP
jgi:hypothetical protein